MRQASSVRSPVLSGERAFLSHPQPDAEQMKRNSYFCTVYYFISKSANLESIDIHVRQS